MPLGFPEIVALVFMVAGGLIVGFLLFVAIRLPDEFRIARSGFVNASPATVFAIINDLKAWDHWSPWEKLDPNMKKTYSGPPAGKGASHAWSGNSKAGEGRMTIVDCQANDYIEMQLEFIKPWVCTNQVRFDLKPDAAGTQVTWSMTGTNNFMAKLFGFLMNMDKMVGKDFEEGLANLDRIAQADSKK
jgi:Polyketide cyclase / dehydrase and lipid transport